MRKLLALFVLVLMTAGVASAALINVTQANYIVTSVDINRHAFGVDLVQNGARNTRTEIRVNKNAKCYWVHKGRADTPMSVDAFVRNLQKGTRVRVDGGRDWDGKINASDLWAQD